jgi:Cu(I)/Ag(I) efflux system membrane fusion protein
MNTRHTLIAIGAAAALAAGGYALYQVGMHRGMGQAGGAAAPATGSAWAEDPTSSIAAGEAATRRHIKEGSRPAMSIRPRASPSSTTTTPWCRGTFDAPAKSPFMDMMLVPVYGGAGGDDQGTVTVSPRIQQNLGVRTAEVVEGTLAPMVSAVGSIAWNERDQSVVQARATGYIEKLHVRATLDRVRAGPALRRALRARVGRRAGGVPGVRRLQRAMPG